MNKNNQPDSKITVLYPSKKRPPQALITAGKVAMVGLLAAGVGLRLEQSNTKVPGKAATEAIDRGEVPAIGDVSDIILFKGVALRSTVQTANDNNLIQRVGETPLKVINGAQVDDPISGKTWLRGYLANPKDKTLKEFFVDWSDLVLEQQANPDKHLVSEFVETAIGKTNFTAIQIGGIWIDHETGKPVGLTIPLAPDELVKYNSPDYQDVTAFTA